MNEIDYWPMTREHTIWHAAVSTMEFWSADLTESTLKDAIQEVYTTFFYTSASQILHWFSDESLFGHFITTLNSIFHTKFVLEDDSYESGSEHCLPVPLLQTTRIHHVCSAEHASYSPTASLPPHSKDPRLSTVQRRLTLSSSD